MTEVPLLWLAHARSGDKGNAANIGVVAYDQESYDIIEKQVTSHDVMRHFKDVVEGPVVRYELPNLLAFNFVIEGALDGGGTVSLRTDAQGKVLSAALLRLTVRIPEAMEARIRGRGRVPAGWSPEGS